MTLPCRDWRDCKHALLKQFKGMVEGFKREGQGAEPDRQLVLSMLLGIVDGESAHGYSLLLLWASQSNAIPVSM